MIRASNFLSSASKIANNQFSIAGGKPGLEISWQVTGVRKDAYATAHPFKVVEDKPAELRGKYLHPKEQGVSEELGVDYTLRKYSDEQQKAAADRAKNSNGKSADNK